MSELTEDDLVPSSFKVDDGDETLQQEFREDFKDTRYEFVDVPSKKYWQNDEETVVIKVPNTAHFENMIILTTAIHGTHADEVDVLWTEDGNAVFRIWWD